MSQDPFATDAVPPSPARPSALDKFLRVEAQRSACRRQLLFGTATSPDAANTNGAQHECFDGENYVDRQGSWALALSGGGIRSATFCLGVLQALTMPSTCAVSGMPPAMKRRSLGLQGLLPQFDYISSVSGGGFVAGFVQRLFSLPKASPTANSVYAHLAHAAAPKVSQDEKPTPLAWLRDNGRYLAPSGTGDLAYALGLGIRNWAGIQLLFGAAIMFVVALWALLISTASEPLQHLLDNWWGLPLIVLLCWVIPSAGAYWTTRDIGALANPAAATAHWFLANPFMAKWLSRPIHAVMTYPLPILRALAVLLIGFGLLNVGVWDWDADALATLSAQATPAHCADHPGLMQQKLQTLRGSDSAWTMYFGICGAILVLTVLWAVVASCLTVRKGSTSAKAESLAVFLTDSCKSGMQAISGLLVLALVLHLAHAVLTLRSMHTLLVSGGTAGMLTGAYRVLMKIVPLLRGAGSSLGIVRGIPRRAVGALLGTLAIALVLFVAVFWTTTAEWLMVPADRQSPLPTCTCDGLILRACWDTAWNLPNVLGVGGLCLLFIGVAGHWPSILNMSSYHYFYSSRLRRAYLGAGNPRRTTVGPGPASQAGPTEPVDGDDIEYAQYHANPAAPLHLINITLNQTVDPSEQLVQRDRKGKSFVVLPDIHKPKHGGVRVSIDGKYQRVTGNGAKLKIAEWLAVSGAAVSTGMGRQTSVGAAICVTMANARIGMWWPGRDRDGLLRQWMPTYPYLTYELLARFHGCRRRYLYLTDGGHFENTATYELLRRVKNDATSVRFILMCDCGADPEYRYDDLANLVRLARVDFGLEVEVDDAAPAMPALGSVFGTPQTMGPADLTALDERCAILLNVCLDGTRLARIIMIKPRLISCASSDLLSYYRNNPVFPQQPTSDQFFDDEQWESYRKLGLACCHSVLDLGAPLWAHVLS